MRSLRSLCHLTGTLRKLGHVVFSVLRPQGGSRSPVLETHYLQGMGFPLVLCKVSLRVVSRVTKQASYFLSLQAVRWQGIQLTMQSDPQRPSDGVRYMTAYPPYSHLSSVFHAHTHTHARARTHAHTHTPQRAQRERERERGGGGGEGGERDDNGRNGRERQE